MNGLANITIGGQVVRLKFGLPAVRRIFEKMAEIKLVDVKDGKESYNDVGISHILFAGYLNGCMLKDELPVLLFEDFYEFVEDFSADRVNKEEIIAAIRSFEESRFIRPISDKIEESLDIEKKRQLSGMT